MRSNPRRRAREFALQGLYQRQLSGNAPAAIRTQLAEAGGFALADRAYFDNAVVGRHRRVRRTRRARSRPGSTGRAAELSPVERAILVIGAWELAHRPEIPYRVVINEAVELAKSYGGTDGHKFVNGVLDKLAGAIRADEIRALATERAAGAAGA